MFKYLILLCSLLFLSSCNCQKSMNANDKEIDVISSKKIKAFLREKNFDIVSSANLVISFDIKKSLIEGTTDEYSNKVVLKDTLEKNKADKLLELIKNDSSYNWAIDETYSNFNPVRQFLIRNNSERLVLVINENSKQMGFINLEGQKVVTLSANFSELLKEFE